MSPDWLDTIHWNPDGLIPAIAQETGTGKVLMLAWMNRESLQRTLETGEAVYWSRSRQRLWHKGESSGNTQRVVQMRLDCDRDTLLLEVEQRGGIACHTGRHNCFYHRYQDGDWQVVEPVLKDPDQMYGDKT
ncbi:phosphoribosyl-AMP cyclohydrolase [Thioalkalivibrio sulfidiphilus]|uniref:Phosphoribosyl-AMP cyclohydrolase n=1 Tax=Thioalkalivibrio sulfidiphilus (strain HL-EbGR7) TaxID=396588 RepID=HIS3_THISH|nr:phosphoribosyl-AMP cyclohydrolase [Thioalkalivibrio sulfidiphilus]B8GU33.1 RecName: Full=Phosphoribosyl-AMP cyclohydrolase; Short=PRA-CH [Thioalkalivibrio sulfidiphilus HL-EbGr7]ACL71316.1 Phosphoribosyl-AMP cyclohydrolase [Thioalkalivibrio sulfidiphilus HL-EbGr7]